MVTHVNKYEYKGYNVVVTVSDDSDEVEILVHRVGGYRRTFKGVSYMDVRDEALNHIERRWIREKTRDNRFNTSF